jgi:hypothetical protein
VLMFALHPFAPQSPWWLVQEGKLNKAETMLGKLRNISEEDRCSQLAMMVTINIADIGNEDWNRLLGLLPP